MTLEIIQTTQLVGNLKIGNELVKSYTVNIDNKGISTIYENLYNEELYAANRKEMRKQEAEFRDKRYEVEDAILAGLEITDDM
ncbi:hypothetical protein P7J31_04945 [Streptococcus suis]|uniref:hypothetical protein n=1 Tax=Streptococcus suis TaxID=1307 RepID=UPI002A7BFE8C|nr:hypothetical protein [Streptococcus suis]